jgi:hypothetical protein
VLAREERSGLIGFEAPHTSDPALDAAVVLFEPVIQVSARPVPDRSSERRADCPGVGSMAVCRHSVRPKPAVAFAERKKALAAAMSRCSLSMASIRFPSRSMAR